jgi:hypothetical protein
MSYAELGRSRGISAASAKRLSNRRRWRKQSGNDGTTRVAVPIAEAVPREIAPGDVSGDVPSIAAGALAALEGAVLVLREQLERAEAGRAEQRRLADEQLAAAEARSLAEQARALAAESRADAAAADVSELRTHAAKLQAQMAEQQATLQRLQALEAVEAERKARGLMARLRAAVRGE